MNSITHKYTINLPKALYLKAKSKAEALGIYSVSIYFRAILIREIENPLYAQEIIKGREESIITDSAKHRREYLKPKWKFNFLKFIDNVKGQQYTLF